MKQRFLQYGSVVVVVFSFCNCLLMFVLLFSSAVVAVSLEAVSREPV